MVLKLLVSPVSAFDSRLWDLVPAIAGGVIGALAGGIPAFLVSRHQMNETLRRDREERLERDKVLAFSTNVKMMEIINELLGLYQHVTDCMESMPSHKTMEAWQLLIPMIGYSEESPPQISIDELAFFARNQGGKLGLDLIELSKSHGAVSKAFHEYMQLRKEFNAIAPKIIDFNSGIAGSTLTPTEALQLKRYTVPMNNAATAIAANLQRYVDRARALMPQLHDHLSKHFKNENYMSIEVPSNEELADRRAQERASDGGNQAAPTA